MLHKKKILFFALINAIAIVAFLPLERYHHAARISLTMAAPEEAFQRRLLETRFKYEANSSSSAVDAAAEVAVGEASKVVQRNSAADLAAKKEVQEKEAAELFAKKEAEEKATAKLAAEQEAERKAAEEQQAIIKEQEMQAAREKANEELAAKRAEEGRIRAEEDRKKTAKQAEEDKKASMEIQAKAAEELETLASRNKELKERVKSFNDRLKSTSFPNLLPSAISDATAAIQRFKPKEAALTLKSREESNTKLVRVVASGAANVLVDGLGAGIELADSFRADDELKSVLGDALDTTGAAFRSLANTPFDTVDTVGSLKIKAKAALVAFDSLGVAAYASLCALVGYTQAGTPVAESASRASEGLVSATSAAVALGLRGFDLVAEQSEGIINEAKEAVRVAEELDNSSSSSSPAVTIELVDEAPPEEANEKNEETPQKQKEAKST